MDYLNLGIYQQEYFKAIVESSDDAIIGKALDGTILSWNDGAMKLYGYRAEEVIGKSIFILVPPEHTDEILRIFETLRKGERIEHFETIRLRKDGRSLHVSLTISPIKDAANLQDSISSLDVIASLSNFLPFSLTALKKFTGFFYEASHLSRL